MKFSSFLIIALLSSMVGAGAVDAGIVIDRLKQGLLTSCVKSSIITHKGDSLYTVEAAMIVDSSTFGEKRQFLQVIIKGTSLLSPGAYEHHFVLYDSVHYVTPIKIAWTPKGNAGLFTVDLLSVFNGAISVDLFYGPRLHLDASPLVKDICLSEIIQPLDATFYDDSIPIADRHWLKTKLPEGATKGLIQKIPNVWLD